MADIVKNTQKKKKKNSKKPAPKETVVQEEAPVVSVESEEQIAQKIGLTKEEAKAELERRISEKLANLSLRDLDELLSIEEEREKEREKVREKAGQRKRKRKTEHPPAHKQEEVVSEPIPSFVPEPEVIFPPEEVSLPEEIAASESLESKEAKDLPAEVLEEVLAEVLGEVLEEIQETTGEEIVAVLATEPIESPEERESLVDRFYAFIGNSVSFVKGKAAAQLEKVYEKNPEKKVIREKKNRKTLIKFTILRRRFARREREAAVRMGELIENMDKRNEEWADRTSEMVIDGTKKFNLAREWADLNKKKLLTHFAAALIIVLGIVTVYNYVTAYEYAYNGRVLGMVKNQEDVLKIVDLVSGQLSKEHGAEIEISRDQDITFNRVLAIGKDIDNMEDVLKRMTYMQDMTAKGCGIYVDGKRIAIVDNKDTAEAVLERVKNTYLPEQEGIDYEEVGFAENIEFKQVETKLGRLMNPDKVYNKFMTGAIDQKSHVVVAGETFSGISKMYGISMDVLKESNPAVTPEKLSIGQEIILSQSVPMLTVQTVELITEPREIPYDTTYEESSSMFKDQQTVKVPGVNGMEQVTSRVVKNNGAMVTELVLDRQVLSQPSTAVVTIGTKDPPPKQGTGHFIYPVQGARLTSKYGARWGRTHYGIDLACSKGTKIVASDGGTVTFSGYSGSYGYVVKIDHGGGFTTVYAHCSKLVVKKGEKVYQGQHIANVGSTGRSTGPHCHFEVQVNGTQKNPLNYL